MTRHAGNINITSLVAAISAEVDAEQSNQEPQEIHPTFPAIPALPAFRFAIVKSIARMSHCYAWMTYPEIRKGLNSDYQKYGKQAILSTLSNLEHAGIVRSKKYGKSMTWGFTPAFEVHYKAWLESNL